jgi:hypothetical protein
VWLLVAHAAVVRAQPADSGDAVVVAEGLAEGLAEVDDAAGPVLLELLEFIGEFTTEDGEWVDPVLLLEAGALADGTPVLGARGAGDEQAVQVENCIAPRCE